MLSLSDLRPGDLMIGPIGGLVPGVLPVAAGQLLLAPAEMQRTLNQWWTWRHAAVVVEGVNGVGRDGQPRSQPRLVQAEPGGAEEIGMQYRQHWTRAVTYIRPAYGALGQVEARGAQEARTFYSMLGIPGQAWAVAHAARQYVGVKYSFADYAALALHRFTDARGALSRYVTRSKRMICSQLADQALSDAGWHTFTDGRLPQDVMPAELACALLGMPGEHMQPGDLRWAPNTSWPGCCAGSRLTA